MLKKILLVDDDPDDKELFCEALHKIDSSAICYLARDGKEALDNLTNREIEKPDIIFLDINMPVMDGWECLTTLKTYDAYKQIPVIIYSTSDSKRDADIALSLGASCFCSKPDDFGQLMSLIDLVVTNLDRNLFDAMKKFETEQSHNIFTCFRN